MCSLSFTAGLLFERGYRLILDGLDPAISSEMADEIIRSAPSALDELYNISETMGAIGQALLAYLHAKKGDWVMAEYRFRQAEGLFRGDSPFTWARIVSLMEQVGIRFHLSYEAE